MNIPVDADAALREQQLLAWLDAVAPGASPPEPASSDASFRRYFRINCPQGSRIVMDAPPPQEDCRPFVHVAGLLQSWGVRAPQVLAADLERGFLLLTDLGNTTFLQALDGDDPDRLYRAAIDTLITMQAGARAGGFNLPPYDRALLAYELALFSDWLMDRHLGRPLSGADASAWEDCCQFLSEASLVQPRVFVHRDYHSRNLMWSGDGVPGVLDFQDAVEGPLSYDLVSLLRDCYQRWPDEQIDGWLDYYRERAAAAGLLHADAREFRRWFDLTGVQRHLKASGIFCRLNHRDGKPGYLGDVPRTLGYIRDVSAAYPELRWLHELVGGIDFMSPS